MNLVNISMALTRRGPVSPEYFHPAQYKSPLADRLRHKGNTQRNAPGHSHNAASDGVREKCAG